MNSRGVAGLRVMEWISGPSHKRLSRSFNRGQGRNQRGKKKKQPQSTKRLTSKELKARGSFFKNRLQLRRTRKERDRERDRERGGEQK